MPGTREELASSSIFQFAKQPLGWNKSRRSLVDGATPLPSSALKAAHFTSKQWQLSEACPTSTLLGIDSRSSCGDLSLELHAGRGCLKNSPAQESGEPAGSGGVKMGSFGRRCNPALVTLRSLDA